MTVNQSVCVPMMKPETMPLAEFLALVKSIGFPAVEIWGRDRSFDELVKLCRQHNLALVSMVGHGQDLNNPEHHDSIERQLCESIDIAAEHRIPGIICLAGNRRPGVSDDEGIAATAAGLKRVASHAEKEGVNLNLEILNSKVDHPGHQCDSSAFAFEVCRRVGSPRVKVLYDIYHAQIMEGDIIRTIRDNAGSIGHFHTAGVPGRGPIDDTQELNYTAICGAISESGYSLFVGHEFKVSPEKLQASLQTAFSICGGLPPVQ